MEPGYEIDFLPVGKEQSGDAIALRFGNMFGPRNEQVVVVIDGGFTDDGQKVVDHIRQHYGTNRIDLVVSSHPDSDHAAGLETVLTECQVGCLWMHQPWNHTDDIAKMFKDGRVTDTSVSEALRKSLEEAKVLERIALTRKIPLIEPFAGVSDASGSVWVLGPSQLYYESLLPSFRPCPEPISQPQIGGFFFQTLTKAEEALNWIAESFNFETLDDEGETSAENNSSTVLLIVVGERYILLTADAGAPAISQALDLFERAGLDKSKIVFVQVPHHGSKRNIGPTLLDRLLGPRLQQETKARTAFVSVARVENAKHPSKRVTNAFRRRGAPVLATGGQTKNHYWNAPGWPARHGWVSVDPLPLYTSFEE
jgi:beta-lactamase superfamily II metal-dependent hydrolase